MKEKAYAKINLGLHVVGKRADEYHDLDMIMVPLELCDELIFEESDKQTIKLYVKGSLDIQLEDNIVYKAAKMLQERYSIKKGAKITLTKRIPQQAGLGGGSADAAATLRGLNQLWNLQLSLEELSIIASDLGSDVPFCLYNKTARVQGRGEILTFLEDMPRVEVLLLQPGFSCSTKEIFSGVRQKIQSENKIKKMEESIAKRDVGLLSNYIFNDLEEALRNIKQEQYREIQKIKEEFKKAGAIATSMTGSGSVVYALALSQKQATKIKQLFENKNKEKFQVTGALQIPYTMIQTSVKSDVKSVVTAAPVKEKEKTIDQISDKILIKAHGWIPLFKRQVNKQIFEEVITPLHQYDVLEVYKIKQRNVIVKDTVNSTIDFLEKNLVVVLNKLGLQYGLEVRVIRNIREEYGITNDYIYLAAVLNSSLELFQTEPNKLFQMFDIQVKKYMYQTTTEVSNGVSAVPQIPMGYVVLAKTKIPARISQDRVYKEEKHTNYKKQRLIRALSDENFYEVMGNLYLDFSKDVYKSIKSDSYNRGKLFDLERLLKVHHANHFLFTEDGSSVYYFLRNQKDAKELADHLEKEYYIRFSDFFSLKSETKHRPIQSKVLKVVEEIIKEEISVDIALEEEKKIYDLSKFEGRDNADTEGILYIHSPGSLFKQYDFVDLAYYFFENFHDKTLYLHVDNKEIPIYFHMDNLGHIFGLHLIDENQYKGRKGAYALLNGEITQKDLKSNLEKSKYDQILQKTQSTVLVLNDLFANKNMGNIDALTAVDIKSSGSKMGNLVYAIRRKIAVGKQDEWNMLGIGYESNQNRYFFLTSFTWKPQKHISNYTFLDVSVKANNY